jgi:hypothetical protein
MTNIINSDSLAHDELIELQKEILEETKDEMKESSGEFPKGIKKYFKEYKSEILTYSEFSNRKELIDSILSSDIVYVGDYHTLGQAQKAFSRILSNVLQHRKDIIIGMEMVFISSQRHLDKYINGELNDKDFLHSIKYMQRWGFNWHNYKPIFQIAIDNKLKIQALNFSAHRKRNPLKLRDMKAAETIAKLTNSNPGKLILVFFGDMHVASCHLPKYTRAELEKLEIKRKDLIIFQNSDELYFKLVQANKENQVEVLKLKNNSYCIMNTTPYIKYQSRLHWNENKNYYLCKFYDIGMSEKTCGDDINFEEDIKELLESISRYFILSSSEDPNFQAFTYDSISLHKIVSINKKQKQELKSKIKFHESFFLPELNFICLKNPNTNHMAEQAAIYLYYSNSLLDESKLGSIDIYFVRIIINTIGYLCSKIINPKRKCSMLKDHQLFIEIYRNKKLKPKLNRQKEVSHAVMRHYEILEKGLNCISELRSRFRFLASYDIETYGFLSESIGHILGENLFYAILQDKINRKQIRKLFFQDFKIPGSSFAEYIDLEMTSRKVKMQYDSKSERF